MTVGPTSPAIVAPKVAPAYISVTSALRRRTGMYSEVSAIATGMDPPAPNPVKNR